MSVPASGSTHTPSTQTAASSSPIISKRTGGSDTIDRLGADLVEGLGERLRRLCTRDAVFAVDDEERHTADPVRPRLIDVGGDGSGVLPRLQRGEDGVALEADISRQIGQFLGAADVPSLLEVRLEQALGQIRLSAVRFREMQGFVRLQCLGVLQPVEVVVETDAGAISRT